MLKIKKTELHLIKDENNWEDLGLDLQKGILLMGNIGVGKTTIINEYLNTKWFNPLSGKVKTGHRLNQRELNSDFKRYQNYESIKHYYMFIDDLADQGKTNIKVYGEIKNPASDLIALRYNVFVSEIRWDESDGFNYFTSNYSLDNLAEELGGSIVDRLYEMCNFIEVGGTSWRSGNLNGKIN